MADNPQVLAPTPDIPDSYDDPDAAVFDALEEWLRDLKQELADALKNLKADTAAAVLRAFERFGGKEKPGAFTHFKPCGGPSRDDRIVVIGGGPAGVHMAYLLKTSGYRDIVILEKEDRVGGKSFSYEHELGDKVKHELGSCYMSPDYVEVHRLLEAMNIKGEEKVIGRTIFDADDDKRGEGMSFETWLHDQIRDEVGKKKMSEFAISFRLLQDSVRYIRLHHRLFGKYGNDGFLMAEPIAEDVKEELSVSLDALLRKNDLLALLPIFKLALTLQGYGFVESTPALYGLMWVTPKLIIGLVEQLKVRRHLPGRHSQADQEEDVSRSITVLRDGLQSLWTKIVEETRIDVRYNCRITSIRRDVDRVVVRYTSGPTAQPSDDSFDFLVVAAPIADLLSTRVLDFTRQEEDVFSLLESSTFVTTLFEYTGPAEDDDRAVHSWFGNLKADRPFAVWSLRDTYKLYRENHGAEHPLTAKLPVPLERSAAVAYQFSSVNTAKADDMDIDATFVRHFARHQLDNVQVVKRCKWSYFPHFSLEALQAGGNPWRILELQGKNRTWYVGSSTCFEALNAIISYNKRLVEVWNSQGRS